MYISHRTIFLVHASIVWQNIVLPIRIRQIRFDQCGSAKHGSAILQNMVRFGILMMVRFNIHMMVRLCILMMI